MMISHVSLFVLSGSQSVEVSGLLCYSQEYTRECLHFIVKLLNKEIYVAVVSAEKFCSKHIV